MRWINFAVCIMGVSLLLAGCQSGTVKLASPSAPKATEEVAQSAADPHSEMLARFEAELAQIERQAVAARMEDLEQKDQAQTQTELWNQAKSEPSPVATAVAPPLVIPASISTSTPTPQLAQMGSTPDFDALLQGLQNLPVAELPPPVPAIQAPPPPLPETEKAESQEETAAGGRDVLSRLGGIFRGQPQPQHEAEQVEMRPPSLLRVTDGEADSRGNASLPRDDIRVATEDPLSPPAPVVRSGQMLEEEIERVHPALPSQSAPSAGFESEVVLDENIYDSPFRDISNTDPMADAARYLYDLGIIGGYADGTFRPGEVLTRASAVKFIILLSGREVTNRPNNGRFRDLPDGQWFTPYMLTAADAGFLRIPTNRLLRPADGITLREFLKLLARSMSTERVQPGRDLADEQLIAVARHYGLNDGRPLAPRALGFAMTRAQGLEAMYQILARPQVHYVGVREGRYHRDKGKNSGRCYRPFGEVRVSLRASPRPITLALAAHEPVIWKIEADEGARLDRIFVSGYHLADIEGAGAHVPIEKNFFFQRVSEERGERRWFVDAARPQMGYFLDGCTADEYRADAAPRVPPEAERDYFHVSSGGDFFSSYRDENGCGADSFCLQQITRDRATFKRLSGLDISDFHGSFSAGHFVIGQ